MFDTMIFSLTLWKTVKERHNFESVGGVDQLSELIFRDGKSWFHTFELVFTRTRQVPFTTGEDILHTPERNSWTFNSAMACANATNTLIFYVRGPDIRQR